MVIRRPGHRAKIGQPPHIRSIELHRIDIRDHPALIESPPNDPLPIRRKKWPAIITGGSGGIGRACASAFAKAGANVVIASLPPDSIPPVVQEVEALGVEGLGLATDVSNAEQVKSMADQTLSKFGRVDVLVNVAGGSYSRNPYVPSFKRAPLLDLAPEDFMRVYEINTKSAFLCAKAVVPAMKAYGKENIINIGSISGRGTKKERADMAAYGSAKAAVMNLTLHMAHQWGPEVRVNCIAPGIIDTPRPQGINRPELASEAVKPIALGRVGKPDEAASVALLASDAASFVSGAVIDVTLPPVAAPAALVK